MKGRAFIARAGLTISRASHITFSFCFCLYKIDRKKSRNKERRSNLQFTALKYVRSGERIARDYL